jgi:hypothetical protein
MMETSTTASENTTENAYHGMESAQHQQQHNHQQRQFSCLYTKHKTQKRKIWQDGRLILKGCLAVLHDANPPAGSGDPALCQCELTRPQINNICSNQHEGNLETEKFLINVEGAWMKAIVNLQPTAPRPPAGTVSTSMKKILTKKYRKPGAYVPPHPMQQRAQQEQQQQQQQQQQSSLMGKRKQPLQPGELQRRHYGNIEPQRGDSYARPPPLNMNMNQQQQQQYHTRPPPMNLNQQQHQQHPDQQQQQQQHHHGPGGAPPSSTNNGECYAGRSRSPPPLQSLSQSGSTALHQSDGYRQAQFQQRQPVLSNPANVEDYQQQQQHNPYHPQQGMHDAAQGQPRQQLNSNNDNVPRTDVTPTPTNNPYNYNTTSPQQIPLSNNPETPRPSTLAPPNQPDSGGNGTANGMRPTAVGQLPVTRKEQSSIFATGNGFDPSSFYGEDDLEEEEDDDDDDDDPVQDDSQFSAQPPSTQARARDSGVASDRSTTATTTAPANRNESPPRMAPTALPDPPRGGGDSGGTTLSTNELLSLFGAAPAPVPVHRENVPAPLPPVETSHQVSDVARGAERVYEDEVVEDDHFVLPPPCDSSSDEDEE